MTTFVLYECPECDATVVVDLAELPFELKDVEDHVRQCTAHYSDEPEKICGAPMSLRAHLPRQCYEALRESGIDPFHLDTLEDRLAFLELEGATIVE